MTDDTCNVLNVDLLSSRLYCRFRNHTESAHQALADYHRRSGISPCPEDHYSIVTKYSTPNFQNPPLIYGAEIGVMSSITLYVSEDEKMALEAFSSEQGLTISHFLRQTALEKLEDAYDVQVYQNYLKQRDKKFIPFVEVIKDW